MASRILSSPIRSWTIDLLNSSPVLSDSITLRPSSLKISIPSLIFYGSLRQISHKLLPYSISYGVKKSYFKRESKELRSTYSRSGFLMESSTSCTVTNILYASYWLKTSLATTSSFSLEATTTMYSLWSSLLISNLFEPILITLDSYVYRLFISWSIKLIELYLFLDYRRTI